MSGLPKKKIISPETKLVLPPVFDSDKYEALRAQLEIVRTDLTKTLSDNVHKPSEDVAIHKSHKASLKFQINKLHKKLVKPLGIIVPTVGLKAEKEIADLSTAAPGRNPAKS
jgi:hypothetical protein